MKADSLIRTIELKDGAGQVIGSREVAFYAGLLSRAHELGLLPADLDDAALEARLYPRPATADPPRAALDPYFNKAGSSGVVPAMRACSKSMHGREASREAGNATRRPHTYFLS